MEPEFMETVNDQNLLEYAFKAIVAIGVGISGYFCRLVMSDQKDLRIAQEKTGRELAEFKLHVSENYSREINTQASLGRIHDRLDEVAGDIKQLLARDR